MSYSYIGYVRSSLADDLPRLANYREAELWCQAVKPFSKGRSVGKKPLGRNRKYDRLTIRASCDYTTNNYTSNISYIVKHYDTDILKYKADGSLYIHSGGYDSISTVQALQELLGPTNFVRRRLKAYYKDRNGHFFRIKDGLKVNADGTADTSTLEPEVVHLLNRPAFKAVKARYAEFLQYAVFVNTLTQGGEGTGEKLMGRFGTDKSSNPSYWRRSSANALTIDTTQMRWYAKFQLQVRQQFFDALDAAISNSNEQERLEEFNELATFLSFSASTRITGSYIGPTNEERRYTWEVDNKRLNTFFDGLLKFRHADKVFSKGEVPLGDIRHDSNAKYIMYATP